jgi:hypothetical protein
MIKKRNKFLTFIFACIPGAGQMFLGFMKLGLSLMAVFFFVIFLSSWLNIGPLMYIAPIIWFYAFFDCINKRWSSDEEFSKFKDGYLFTGDNYAKIDGLLKGKLKLVVGILFILIGAKILFDIITANLQSIIPAYIYSTFISIINVIPQFAVGALIIALGIYLIIGRKGSVEHND